MANIAFDFLLILVPITDLCLKLAFKVVDVVITFLPFCSCCVSRRKDNSFGSFYRLKELMRRDGRKFVILEPCVEHVQRYITHWNLQTRGMLGQMLCACVAPCEKRSQTGTYEFPDLQRAHKLLRRELTAIQVATR